MLVCVAASRSEHLHRRPAFVLRPAVGHQRVPARDLAVHLLLADRAPAPALPGLGARAVGVQEHEMRRAPAQAGEQRDRAAGERERPARVDHDRAAAQDGGENPRVVPGVQQRAAPRAVVGVDDPRHASIDGPAQQGGLAGAGHTGDDDDRV